MSAKKSIILSLVSFILLAFCLPPFPLGFASLVVLVPWFFVLIKANKKNALIASFLGAFAFNIISIYWLYHVGDFAPLPLILTGLFLAVCYLSLFTLLCAWFFIKVKNIYFNKKSLVFTFPLFWAGIEILQSKGDMSFPWLSLGLTFGNNLEFMQAFTVFGVFGCSALIIASNLCLTLALINKNIKLGLALLALAISFYTIGYGILKTENNSKTEKETLNIALIQPSVLQTKKWSREYYDSVITQTFDLFKTLNPNDIDVVLFPETAIPDFLNRYNKEYNFLESYAVENNTSIVIGMLNRTRKKEKNTKRNFDVYNSAFLFNKNHTIEEYRKMHLVPFSEKAPFNDIFTVLNYIDLGGANFIPGDSLSIWQPGSFAPLICYEAIFGSILRDAKKKGAKFIANITNDGWFKTSIAPYQHLNLIRSHAVETGISVARAANTGISAFILPNGKIEEKTELFEQRIITHKIPLQTRFTLYSIIGDYFENILFAFSLIMIIFVKIKKSPVFTPEISN